MAATVEPEPAGYEVVPAAPSDEARRANQRALDLHRQGQFAEARAGFEEAVRLAPAWPIAGYNLACARARLGDIDAAAGAIEALLVADLPQFGPRFETDPDLEALRGSARGPALSERVASLAASWQRALELGAPVSVGWSQGDDDSPLGVRSVKVQPGVWVHAWRRFVPMAAPATAARRQEASLPLAAGLFFPAAGRTVALEGVGRNADVPAIDSLVLRVLRVPAGAEEASHSFPGGDRSQISRIEAYATSSGARFRVIDLDVSGTLGAWQELGAAGAAPSPVQDPPAGQALLVMVQEGSFVAWVDPEGFAVEGARLATPAGPVELGRGHGVGREHSIVLGPDGGAAVVISQRSGHGGCGSDEPRRYFVDRVDLRTRSVERLAEGEGWAAATLDSSGALYLQAGDRVRRYETLLSTDEPELLPAGIALVPDPPGC